MSFQVPGAGGPSRKLPTTSGNSGEFFTMSGARVYCVRAYWARNSTFWIAFSGGEDLIVFDGRYVAEMVPDAGRSGRSCSILASWIVTGSVSGISRVGPDALPEQVQDGVGREHNQDQRPCPPAECRRGSIDRRDPPARIRRDRCGSVPPAAPSGGGGSPSRGRRWRRPRSVRRGLR